MLISAIWANRDRPAPIDIAVQLITPAPEQVTGVAASKIWFPLVSNQYGAEASICAERFGPVIFIQGAQPVQLNTKGAPLAPKVIVNAATASWTQVEDYPVVIEGGPEICFSGGTVWGEYSYDTDWETMHDTTAFTFRSSGETTVENIRVHNYGDGISFSRGTADDSLQITRAHMTHIRDDCVQNDYMYSGVVEDSLLDGCYTAFSAQSDSDVNDGSRNVWLIYHSLIRLEPMEKVYQDKGLIPGHGSFFKWNRDNNLSPQLSLHNNIFRADQPSNSGSGLGIPEGKLASCTNNVMVWLGDGPYPDPLPETFAGQPCFTVTTNKMVWDNAVRSWLARRYIRQQPAGSGETN